MEVRVTARHFELTEALQSHAQKQFQRLKRYFNHIVDGHMILSIEKYRQMAELQVKVYGTVLTAKAASNEMYTSIDQVVEKMERQIKRYKGKLTNHKVKKEEEVTEEDKLTL